MARIWVYAEMTAGGVVEKTALEILTKARTLDGDVEAVALGPGATAAAAILGEHGAKTVYASDDPVYGEYVAWPASHALHELTKEHQPNLILFPSTYESRDVAARLAARTGSTIMSNATDLLGASSAQTAIFGGSLLVDVTLEGPDPKIVLVRPKSFDAEPSGGSAQVVPVEVAIPDAVKRSKRVERIVAESSGPKLEEAPVVVAGGRGLGNRDNWKLVEELAGAIGNAAVGATRAVVDAEWVPYALQIGQTGKTVKPRVYLAVGISGATQHIVGMKSSDRIIAINKDAEAPIFQLSDLGIVGDALKIVPALVQEVKSRKA
ncbi:MAG: electron transfer flavoprotein subunit alpha/FixB family protein [Acidobacteria bacterium]|nr:electron transfer flavoprotein subunit alpha/FixB family protein [Acidobacteriota bacterium]